MKCTLGDMVRIIYMNFCFGFKIFVSNSNFLYNGAIADDKNFLTRYKYQKLKQNCTSPTNVMTYQACSNGCWLYIEENNSYCCPSCKSTEVSIHRQISLSSALSFFVCSDYNRNRIMEYKGKKLNKNPFEEPLFTDFYDGTTFQKIRSPNYNHEMHTLDLALYCDGFCPFERSKTKMTLIMFSILNLPPQER